MRQISCMITRRGSGLAGEPQPALHRQLVLLEQGIVFVDGLHVLAVQVGGAADRGYADAEQFGRQLRRIALEVSLQRRCAGPARARPAA
jgi:hypothetical protein